MWVLFAFGSAFFAGITAILCKQGIKNIDSNLATAIRTTVVLIFSCLIVVAVDSHETIPNISNKTLIFLILSGFTTGASWLCYFKALQLGDVNKVTPIDKSSIILTMIFAIAFLGEEITVLKVVAIVLIGVGTYFMIQKQEKINTNIKSNLWLIYAVASAIFASLTSILGKVGIENIESNLGTTIRTVVVLVMAWIIVFVTKKQITIKNLNQRNWIFLILSGIATGTSWLFYYRALQEGPASVIAPIDKLSIIITIAFSYIYLKEKLTKKALLGLILIVVGTMSLLI